MAAEKRIVPGRIREFRELAQAHTLYINFSDFYHVVIAGDATTEQKGIQLKWLIANNLGGSVHWQDWVY